ncbi:protein of unknown function [Methylacidimicrobium sp. AP8]|nr:protein of unknown function [Methylacidimicrobium sp. AP8]
MGTAGHRLGHLRRDGGRPAAGGGDEGLRLAAPLRRGAALPARALPGRQHRRRLGSGLVVVGGPQEARAGAG